MKDSQNLRESLFAGWPGCSDGYCLVRGHAKGMHTNGGCRCLVNASRASLNILSFRLAMYLAEADEPAEAPEVQP